jgi:hypothetical protein
MVISAYGDVPAYLRAPTGQEAASLLGLNTTIGGGSSVPAGTLSLPVVASAGWAAGPLWLLDGPASEVAQVAGAPDATHLTLAAPGTTLAHAPGVSASQAGAGGSLAEAILRASAWIENHCQQGTPSDRSLFAASRTERWGMPGRRALLDVDGILAVRPGHFPVQSVASLAILLPSGAIQSIDVSLAQITGEGRLVEAPLLFVGGAQPTLMPTAISRGAAVGDGDVYGWIRRRGDPLRRAAGVRLDGERAALGAAQPLRRGDGQTGNDRAGGASLARHDRRLDPAGAGEGGAGGLARVVRCGQRMRSRLGGAKPPARVHAGPPYL